MKLFKKTLILFIAFLMVGMTARAQSNLVLFGDVKIDETLTQGEAPAKVMILLVKNSGVGSMGEIGRQPISNGSRYRLSHLTVGDYEIVIEVDNNEVGAVAHDAAGNE